MTLPFSTEAFLGVFAAWNEAIWPLPVPLALLGLAAVGLVRARHSWSDRAIAAILALFWAIVAVGYHAAFFSALTPAAYAYAALFALEAGLLLERGVIRGRLAFGRPRGPAGVAALLAIAYGLAVYPLVALGVTHPYPATPLFGVAPCPTVIFTIGMLLLLRPRPPAVLAAVPLVWAVIGGSAALLLGVPEDIGLPVAGLALLAVLWQRRGGGRPSEA